MNIFNALSNGKGSINEENTSSFLGYLLNPIEDHGMKDVFIKKFLNKINIQNYDFPDISEYDVQLEVPVKDKNTRIIDIVFKTKNHVIAIENKIKMESCQDNQIIEEFNGLKKYVEKERSDKDVIICFLTPQKCTIENYKKNIPNENFRHIEWSNITEILKEIIEEESCSRINPINDYVKQTLKAFINFVNGFIEDRPDGKGKEFELENEKYVIKKYASKKITIERISGNQKPELVSARKIIRQKLDEEYGTKDETCSYERTEPYNTRTLGDKLYKKLAN